MGFELLEDDIVYKQVITAGKNYIKRGVHYQEDPTISYTPVEGLYSPYRGGQKADVLPTGVKSSDALMFLSREVLKTHEDSVGKESLADKIYLTNPGLGRKTAQAYVVHRVLDWGVNSSFKLLDSNDYEYLLIKEGKV